ncbi:MAG: SDR family oxidoreductase [Methylocapsa sp.]|nr:SDR family oxidoreductase [Methylocapsa sp.]
MNGRRADPASNRPALVTGAAKGIGRAIAERLGREGHPIVLHSSPRSLAGAKAAAANICEFGGKARALACDLSEPYQASRLLPEAAEIFGPLALLVNNAAIFEADVALSFERGRLERHLAVNLIAPLLLARDFAVQVPAGTEAAIVNLIDQRVLRPTPQFFSYSLSKSALFAATRTMAQSFAPLGIRVNAVGPGPVSPNVSQGEAGFLQEVQGLPLARGAICPGDIADAVIFLAAARNITGQMIAVDAGQHLAWETPDVVI